MISVIHNTYSKNQYIKESAELNVKALEDSGLPYQYIIYNDHGSVDILEDVKHLLNDKVQYHYSDYNYGMKVCSGGWIGAVSLVKGEYIHNIGQDDVYTSLFYRSLVSRLEAPDTYLTYANGFKVNPDLTIQGQTLGPIQEIDYAQPKKVFDYWFQKQGNRLTAANNYIPAPGVLYKTKVHDIIGLPDLETFKGSADFEYWARVLFNGLGVSYDPRPLWLYRISEHSLGSQPLAAVETPKWNNLILQKYQTLIENE